MLDIFKRKKKARVYFDTNFMMLPGSQGLDIFTGVEKLLNEPYELCVLDATLRELRNITEGHVKKAKGSAKFNAKLGFILSSQKGLKIVKSSFDYADDGLVALADEKTYVCTLDKDLQRRLKEKGAHIIIVKGKTQLVLQ